ncbi:hypothetical protein ACFW04_000576 [Cataglyphis niger]
MRTTDKKVKLINNSSTHERRKKKKRANETLCTNFYVFSDKARIIL